MTAAQAKIRSWRLDPVRFVRDALGVEPDAWQVDALSMLGGEYDPRRRLVLKACTGPGKSALLAWIGWHRLSCFAAPGEHPKGAALSITKDNLSDNLWAEFAKWQGRSAFLSHAFTWNQSAITATGHADTWFLSARSFAKDADKEAIGRALSGLHSVFPFVLLDETGEMPVSVGLAASQIFTGGPIDAAIVQAGNPTSSAGLLYDSVGRDWPTITVTADPEDPKRTPRVSIEHAQQMIREYGRDNPWVMATILGLFPPTGFSSLFGAAEIDAAMQRNYYPKDIAHAPVILGCDVARQGNDESAVARRQGFVAFPIRTMRIPDTMLVAEQFAKEADTHNADASFVDGTGGYGAGVVDALRQLRRKPVEVQFGGKASDERYYNKRSEMYFELSKWLKTGQLPDDPRLKEELIATDFVYQGDKFRIVEKEIIKAKLGRSPDRADALALTFAGPVAVRVPGQKMSGAAKCLYKRAA